MTGCTAGSFDLAEKNASLSVLHLAHFHVLVTRDAVRRASADLRAAGGV